MEKDQRQEKSTSRVQGFPTSRNWPVPIIALYGMQTTDNITNGTQSIGAWNTQHQEDQGKNKTGQG